MVVFNQIKRFGFGLLLIAGQNGGSGNFYNAIAVRVAAKRRGRFIVGACGAVSRIDTERPFKKRWRFIIRFINIAVGAFRRRGQRGSFRFGGAADITRNTYFPGGRLV